MPTYLDDNGDPITAAPSGKVYLDPETGEPLAAPAPAEAPAAGAGADYHVPIVDFVNRFGKGLAGVATGLGKELPLVVERLATAPERLGTPVGAAILERLGATDLAARTREQAALRRLQVEEPFVPKPGEGTAEKVGRTIAKAAPTAALAAATGGASLPIQAAVLGAAGAAQAASEGAGPKEVAVSGALNAAAPFAAPALAKVAGVSEPLRRAAVNLYSRALNPTKEATKTVAKEVIPELIERGVTAGPVAGLRKIGNLADAQVESLGREIGAAYKTATAGGTRIDAAKLADALEPLKVPFTEVQQVTKTVPSKVLGPSGEALTKAVTAEEVTVLNKNAISAIEDLQSTLRDLGDKATPTGLHKFRRVIDDVVNASNGFTRELPRGTAKDIAKQARATLRDSLNRAVRETTPNIEKLNADYTLWKGVQRVVRETERRRTGQQRTVELLYAFAKGGALGGAAGYASSGGSATGAVVGGLVMPAVIKALRSPFARTWGAVEMDALADIMAGSSKALASPAGKQVMTTLGLFGVQARKEEEPAEESLSGE